MSWLKEYGLSTGGFLIAAFITAHTGFNLGVEARVNAEASDGATAITEVASRAPQINPHTD